MKDRSSILGSLLALAMIASTTGALTLERATRSPSEDGGTGYGFEVVQEDEEVGGEVHRESTPAPEAPRPVLLGSYSELDLTPDPPCTRTHRVVITDESERAAATEFLRRQNEAYLYNLSLAGLTPSDVEPCSTITVDVEEVLRTATDDVSGDLPLATPYIQPDQRAITGIRSHLTTGLPASVDRTHRVTLFGSSYTVEVHAVPVSTVDWGDGTVETDVRRTGGEWHDGPASPDDIVHHYLETGTYTLAVTTEWTVTATLTTTGQTRTVVLPPTTQQVDITVEEVRSTRN